jgi:hypothetical protein
MSKSRGFIDFSSYCLVWDGVGDDGFPIEYRRSTHFSPALKGDVGSKTIYEKTSFNLKTLFIFGFDAKLVISTP